MSTSTFDITSTKLTLNRFLNTFVSVILKVSSFSVLAIAGLIVLLLGSESLKFFMKVPLWDFLLGFRWEPPMGTSVPSYKDYFGIIPLIFGTLQITFVALVIAVPMGILSAVYLSFYIHRKFRAVLKPCIEVLAGVPTIVYGYFAATTLAPLIHAWATRLGFEASTESALAAGVTMGIMIVPYITALSDDAFAAIPKRVAEGSFGLGATRHETIVHVLIPYARPNLIVACILAISRAFGETMIVVMAAGMTAKLTFNPLESVTTITVQMLTLITGDQEFNSVSTQAAFALGLFLFVMTFIFNLIVAHTLRKSRYTHD